MDLEACTKKPIWMTFVDNGIDIFLDFLRENYSLSPTYDLVYLNVLVQINLLF